MCSVFTFTCRVDCHVPVSVLSRADHRGCCFVVVDGGVGDGHDDDDSDNDNDDSVVVVIGGGGAVRVARVCV